MIADTNVLLRALAPDAAAQGRAARARVASIRTGEPITVLAATVLEVAFVWNGALSGQRSRRPSARLTTATIASSAA